MNYGGTPFKTATCISKFIERKLQFYLHVGEIINPKGEHDTHTVHEFRHRHRFKKKPSNEGQQQTQTTTPAYLPMQFLFARQLSARVPLYCKILSWRLELTVRPFNL
jgi:hypothetical protein